MRDANTRLRKQVAAVPEAVTTDKPSEPSGNASREILPWLLTAAFLAAAFFVGNHRIVTGRDGPIWDAYAFFAPQYTLVADHARSGRLLVWNPWASGGEPDFADPQIGAASPIAVLMGAVTGGTETGFRWYWIVIWFVGPLGIILLARHLEVPPWAAFVVALGYGFCGFYTGHAEHTSFIYSFSWLPFIFWRLDVGLTSHRLKAAAEAGAIWGLSALGGYPALTILTSGLVGLWTVGRCLVSSGETFQSMQDRLKHRLAFCAVSLLLLFFIGTIVLAPTYMAFFREGYGYSERAGGINRDLAISSNISAPGSFLTFSSPYLATLKYPWWNPRLWAPSDGTGVNNYVGALPLVFALLALMLHPRSSWRWWLVGIILFAYACAVGPILPVRGWLYDYCPPTRYFRHPEIFRACGMFAASVLALLAAREFETAKTAPSSHLWTRFPAASLSLAVCAFLSYLYVTSHVGNLGDQFQRANLHVVGAWFGVLAISILALSSPKSRRMLPVLLVLLALADAALTVRLSQRFISDSTFSRPVWNKINGQHQPGLDSTFAGLQRQPKPPAWLGGTPQQTNTPLRLATLFNDFTARNRFHLDYERHPDLVNMSTGSDRIWFAQRVAVVRPSDAAYDALVQRTAAIGAPVLVVHPAQEMPEISEGKVSKSTDAADASLVSDLPAAERVATQVLRYTPNHLDLRITAPSDGWLLVTDRWASGWRVKVNGAAEEVYGGNLIFRAVRVREGENTVQFSYPHPRYFAMVFLSWATLITLFVALPAYRRLRLRHLWADRHETAPAPQ